MLARKNRFHGHGSVRRVYRIGKPYRSGLFSMHVNQNEKIRSTKAAVVVSRKVHKSAVKRNRIRRRIYEIIRSKIPSFKSPVEIVVTVYSADIAEMPPAELEKSIEQLLGRAKL